MSINLGIADTITTDLKPRIAVVGVGGGGGNAVNNMMAQNLEGVDFIVANTDAQALKNSSASKKIQLGLEITRGLGAGARPEIGKKSAEEARDKIAEALEGLNMVFITAGMGGGTGSGAAPVVAHIAKEKGILTVGVVTKPFSFEGKKRMEIANEALSDFIKEVDSIIVIPNQNLFRIANENTTLAEAFKMADNVLYSGVRSITDLMMMPGLINLDFADVRNIMEDKGKAIMGTGEAEGERRAEEAANQALSNPLLDECSMKGAKGVLINITGGTDITLPELAIAADIIKDQVGDDANIIFGSSYDESLNGKIRVSIVVTGINDGTPLPKENKPQINEGPSLIDQSYDDTSFVPTVEVEPQSSYDEQLSDDEEDEVESEIETEEFLTEDDKTPVEDFNTQIEELSVLSQVENNSNTSLDDDFASLSKSEELPEVPQASALFTAIMKNDNKIEENEKAADELSAIVSSDEDFFSGSPSMTGFNPVDDEEPILFKDNDTSVFKGDNIDETEDVKIEPAEPVSRPSFIERVIGIRARRKNNDEAQKRQEVRFSPSIDSKTGTDDDFDLSGEDLDIPSFLRRK